MNNKTKYDHYYKSVKHLDRIDIYRVLELFNVTDPCVAHAIKKLLVSGGRGVKSEGKDIQEAIDSLLRWQEMRNEENNFMTIMGFENEGEKHE